MLWISLALLSAFFFSLYHIAAKEFSLRNQDAMDFIFITHLFAVVAILPFAGFVMPLASWQIAATVLLNAIMASFGGYLLFCAYKETEISSIDPFLNLSPMILFITSYLLLGEALRAWQYFGVGMIIIGGYFLTLKDIRKIFHPFTSISTGAFLMLLGTLACWSIAAPLAKINLRTLDTLSLFFYTCLFSVFFWGVIVLYRKKGARMLLAARHFWWLGVMGTVFFIGSEVFFMFALAIPATMVSLAIPLRRTATFFSVVIGGRLFDEKNLLLKALSCLVMLAGVFVVAVNA